jgi:3-phosphoshikimate 1-carboxyvinyltransferase
LAMGMRKPIECIIDSPFVSPLRALLPCFGYECRVQLRNQNKNEDPLLRRMRFIKTGKKSEGPPQFGVAVDFSKDPVRQAELTLPGDELFSALIVTAKCLVPRGSLLVENVCLETWNATFLQFLKNMGAVVGAQETHRCSFGSIGSLVVQKISPFGRKVDCRPRYQFARQLPAMLVMAAFAQGQSIFRNLEDLRNEDPDGIDRLNSCISALGARFGEMPDGIVLEGAKQFDGFDLSAPHPAAIAGAFAIAGLKCRGATTVADENILRHWPDFKEMLWSIVEFKE